MLADCHIVIFFNIVRFSLIFQIRRWELFLRKDESQNQIKRLFFLRASFCGTSFLFAKLVSIKHTSHTNNVIRELYVGLTNFSIELNTSAITLFIGGSFTGENHLLVFCFLRIILLSRVIIVDHDWNGFDGVL